MIWLNFDMWNSKHGYFLSWKRIYKKGRWTPFCHAERRYDSWFGYWKKPKSITWLLVHRTITFAGIPSGAQTQEAIDVVKSLGLVPTDQALASRGMFELFLKNVEEPDWKISIPDGHAKTTSIMYKGNPLRVISARLHLGVDEPAFLMLEIWPEHLEATMSALDIEIEICE